MELSAHAMRQLGLSVYPIGISPILQGLNAIKQMTSKIPLEMSYYFNTQMRSIVDRLIAKHEFDLAFGFFMRSATYLENHHLPKIVIAEDCRSVYMKRSYEHSKSPIQKLARGWEKKVLPDYEPKKLNKFDCVTFVSQHDIEFARELGVKSDIRLLTNGTDIDHFKPDWSKLESSEPKIIFTSKFSVQANILMAKSITEEIMPIVWEKRPDIKLVFAGADAEKAAPKRNKNIEIVSYPADMAEVLNEAHIFLHPHKGGSGIQNKLIEAMACGLSVVTTDTGNQGINGNDGRDLFIGQNAHELASLVLRLIEEKDTRLEMGRNARSLIEKNLSWDRVYKDLDNIISDYSN
ncbi:MAG: glycosyltransferase family 4 protein [Candidatus Kapaibacteriales bacterium]